MGHYPHTESQNCANDFEGSPVYRMAQNAVCKIAVDDIALDRQVVHQQRLHLQVMC